MFDTRRMTQGGASTRRGVPAFARDSESVNDGLFEGTAALQGFKDGELFPFEAAEIDGVVDAMDSEIDRSGFETGYGRNLFALLTLFHGVAGDFEGGIAPDREEQVVHGIMQIEKVNVGLQAKTKFGGIGANENRGGDRRFGGAVEGFDLGPFEANHVDSELVTACSVARVFAEPGYEAGAEVAHGEGTRGAVGEVVLGEPIKTTITENRAQAGEIVGEGVEDAEPVLAIVDFEALEGGEAVVGLDDFAGDVGERPAIWSNATHALGGREGSHNRIGDVTLESGEIHTAAAREALARYLLAFSASW